MKELNELQDLHREINGQTNIVAVYGTLRLGYGNYTYLLEGNSEYLGTDIIDDMVLRVHESGSIPFMVRSPGNHAVVDLFRVPDSETWYRMDCLEGHPHWYRRVVETTRKGVKVWTYIGDLDDAGRSGMIDIHDYDEFNRELRGGRRESC